jgi:dGTP triphosphohydrolase
MRSTDETDREKLRLVCDYVASMSDDGAVAAYRRLFEPGSQGLFDLG